MASDQADSPHHATSGRLPQPADPIETAGGVPLREGLLPLRHQASVAEVLVEEGITEGSTCDQPAAPTETTPPPDVAWFPAQAMLPGNEPGPDQPLLR
jgi:hypothetical protein